MFDPEVGESIADFACGTGGFLVSSLEHVRENNDLSIEERENFQNNIHGVEKKSMPYMLCVINMILHDVDVSDIIHCNSLTKNLRDFTEKDKYDVIAMNPPFGSKEQDIIQMNFPKAFQSSETADSFLILIIYRLKINGRVGVIVPDGFMFGNDNPKTNIKKKLINDLDLHTIVRLPGSVFAPYTSIATNILFFDNKQNDNEDIWYYEVPLPEGYKAFSKTKPMQSKHLDGVRKWWENREESEHFWLVKKKILLLMI